LGDEDASGSIILKWIFDKCGVKLWIKLVKDSIKWNAFVSTVMNHRERNFSTNFTVKTPHDGVKRG
jgi:hypothetical protein